eukprot:Seg479.2 transcript_id=Seg479.2/GoldUCD/mRNA.D3Y31 product="FMRFamide-activated amiloride-sensitive sodium channel" protein_id=Seg479.2/GoldUCD/D3Y31
MEFPQITICNANPFKQSGLDKLDDSFTTNFQNISSTQEKNDVLKILFTRKLGKLPRSELSKLGHSKESFLMTKLKACYFAQKECNSSNFEKYVTPNIGNCFKFKSNGYEQRQTGPDSGLSFVVNIHQDDYGVLNNSSLVDAGAIIIIGLSKMSVNVFTLRNRGILLQPGTLTRIRIKKRVIKRLQHPYPDKCEKAKKKNQFSGIHYKKPFPYSIEMCEMSCYARKQMEMCGYMAAINEYFSYLVHVDKSNVKFNNATDLAGLLREHRCLKNASEQFNRGKLKCNCRPMCYEEQYSVTYSSSMWPSKHSARQLLKMMASTSNVNETFRNWTAADIYNNLLKVEVYFDDFSVEEIAHRPAYTWNDFFSDLGGQVGLWIGASVYSCLEIGTLFVNLVSYFIQSKAKRRKVEDLHKEEGAQSHPPHPYSKSSEIHCSLETINIEGNGC